MGNVLLFPYSDERIGYISRMKNSSGPEGNIVFNFLRVLKAKYELQKGDYAFFIEPCLDTGYPDIVVIKYKREKYISFWNSSRNNLQNIDLKVLNFMISMKGVHLDVFVSKLGISESIIGKILVRLSDAGLVFQSPYSKRWHNKSMATIWGIKKISAIEAKIKDCSSAMNQAETNLWFANESTVLFPDHHFSDKILESLSKRKIGAMVINDHEQIKTIVRPAVSRGPCSYASWLFNEWIGRKLFSTGE